MTAEDNTLHVEQVVCKSYNPQLAVISVLIRTSTKGLKYVHIAYLQAVE